MEQRVIPSDLAACLSERRGMDRTAAEAYVRELFLLIEDGLRAESIVKIKGLGTFKLVRVDARESININTGQRFTIEEHTKVSFTPDTPLKNQINKPFSEFETVILNDDVDIAALEAIGAEEQPDDDNDDDDTDNAAEQGAAAVTEPATPDSDASTNLENPTTQPSEPEAEEAGGEPESDIDASTTLDNPTTQPTEPEAEEAGGEPEPDIDASTTLENPTTQPTETEAEEAGEEPEPEEPEPDFTASTTHENPETQPEPEPTAPLTQHIETQRVTDMTVANQHIEHQTIETPHTMEPNAPARLSIWETLALMTFILALMTLSYVAGYNHWLAWGEPQPPTATTASTPAKPDKTATTKPAATPQQPATPAATPQPQAEAPTVVTPTQPAPTQPPLQPAKPAADASANYPQVPGGEYLIVGEQGEHIVKAGDSLRGIALKYYGSKNYVRYIVCMNAIKNPDIVNIGQRIKLPKLEKKAQ